tara:strand:- start:1737 stop:2306 length:570 start_codon:yes stop_codon:yes gene_type:complete
MAGIKDKITANNYEVLGSENTANAVYCQYNSGYVIIGNVDPKNTPSVIYLEYSGKLNVVHIQGYMCFSGNNKALYFKIQNISENNLKNIATYRDGSEFFIYKFQYSYGQNLISGGIKRPKFPTWHDESDTWQTSDKSDWDSETFEKKTKRTRRRQKLANSKNSFVQTKSQKKFKNNLNNVNLLQPKRKK